MFMDELFSVEHAPVPILNCPVHSFRRSDRLGHVINNYTSEQSPLFLLFLDCTWQLLQQFPADFEFSETFLTTLWDSAFVPIFDTFLFNCEHDRKIAIDSVRAHHFTLPTWL